MIAGLPGTGIGGMYYLLLSLWMPVHGLFRKAKRDFPYSKKGIIRPQILLTVMVIAGIWLTGLALGVLLGLLVPVSNATSASVGSFGATQNVIRITPLIITLVTLTLVYMGMQAIRFLVRWHGKGVVLSVSGSSRKRNLVLSPFRMEGGALRSRRTFPLPAARAKRVVSGKSA